MQIDLLIGFLFRILVFVKGFMLRICVEIYVIKLISGGFIGGLLINLKFINRDL
ncbi:hypothetical protein ES702_03626 [subsurface metagenome]